MTLLENRILDSKSAHPSARCAHDAQQVLLQRAKFLDETEHMLVELALGHGVTHRRIAQMLTLSTSAVTRRMQSIVRRLCDPLGIALIDPRCSLPTELRQIGIEHFLRGCSLRQLAELHRISTHQVRRMLQNVRAWFRWTEPLR